VGASNKRSELEDLAAELGEPRPVRRVGRPTAYSDEIAAEICEAVAEGLALYKAANERPHWPDRATIYRWADERPEFRERFARARELKAHLFVDEMPEIAADAIPTNEHIRLAELRIKTRQWVAPMLARNIYGQMPAQVSVANQINIESYARLVGEKLEALVERKELDAIDSASEDTSKV